MTVVGKSATVLPLNVNSVHTRNCSCMEKIFFFFNSARKMANWITVDTVVKRARARLASFPGSPFLI